MIAARVTDELLNRIDIEVEKARYLDVSRSEVIEIMLEIVLDAVEDKDKFSRNLRARVIEKRKKACAK